MQLPFAAPDGRVETFQGSRIHRGFLDRPGQEALVAEIRKAIRDAPLSHPMTPWGKPMSVGMASAGEYGWVSDRSGYRYEALQPGSGRPWPPIPPIALAVWNALAHCPRAPQCCLINYYGEGARMGLHRDADEEDMTAPVVSVSLGDPARFRVGGTARRDPTRSTMLESGDVVVLEGASRLAYHGIDGIRHGRSELLARGGRINLTLRVVTARLTKR